jgi:hypothetical protein
VSEVPVDAPTQTHNEIIEQIEATQIEAQKGANGQLGEFFEDLGLTLPNDATEENERKELYAVAASLFA